MSEKKTFTEYELKSMANSLSYISSAQKSLVIAALVVHGNGRGFDRDGVREMLGKLVQASLLSESTRKQILKKLFE